MSDGLIPGQGGFLGPTLGGGGGSSANIVASWSGRRYYAVDFDSGSDTAIGYGTTMALAGANALKTWAGLLAVLPPVGAGREVVIAVKLRAGGVSYGEDLRFVGYMTYNRVWIVGTTDFTDSAADRIVSGAVTSAAGPNVDGSWTVAGGATSSVFSVAAGALPAEPTAVLKRIRFLPTTTSAALRNATTAVYANTGTQITVCNNLPAAPAAGDVFLIEEPGVAFDNVYVRSGVAMRGIASTTNAYAAFSVAGPASYIVDDNNATGGVQIAFCEARGGSSAAVTISDTPGPCYLWDLFAEPDTTYTTTGMGMRAQGGLFVTSCTDVFLSNVGAAGFSSLLDVYSQFNSIGAGCRFAAGLSLSAIGGTECAIGNLGSPGYRPLRVNGQLAVSASEVHFVNVEVLDAGASPAIAITGRQIRVRFENVTGSSGNTNVGISFAAAVACLFNFTGTNTLTGTVGEIRLGDGTALATYAGLSVTNVVDSAGNVITGAGGTIVGPCVLVSNQAAVSALIGDIMRGNGTTGQVTTARADTSANASGPLLVMVTEAAAGAPGYAVPLNQYAPWVNFDAAPASGVLAYLDEGTAALATTTVPPLAATNQKRRLGHTLTVSGTRARLVGSPELLPILSDGVAP